MDLLEALIVEDIQFLATLQVEKLRKMCVIVFGPFYQKSGWVVTVTESLLNYGLFSQ